MYEKLHSGYDFVFASRYLNNEKSDDDLHREAFYVSKKVYQLTDTINTYQYSGYLKTAEIIEEWPELPKSDPLRLGKFEMSTTKIPTKGYETIHEFLQDEENKKLQYIVLDKRNEFFNDLRELAIFIIIKAWQRPTLPYLKTKYHRR